MPWFNKKMADKFAEAMQEDMEKAEREMAIANDIASQRRQIETILRPVEAQVPVHVSDMLSDMLAQGDYAGACKRAVDVRLTLENRITGAAQAAPVKFSDHEKLAARLDIPKNVNLPMCINLVRKGDKVHVFGLAGDEPFTLTDDGNLFPSDELITKLRMLNA